MYGQDHPDMAQSAPVRPLTPLPGTLAVPLASNRFKIGVKMNLYLFSYDYYFSHKFH